MTELLVNGIVNNITIEPNIAKIPTVLCGIPNIKLILYLKSFELKS